MALTADALAQALADDAFDAGITINTRLEPLAGPGAPVKPAGYASGNYQVDQRWFGQSPERTNAIVIDNVPSQANRLEAALSRLRVELGLPEIMLDLSGIPTLPPHLPRAVSSFVMPHRQADAYLRDSLLEGKPFAKTKTGADLLSASVDNPEALLRWFPQALLFGFWHSHLGNKRSQAKLSRGWVSEIVGYDPAPAAESPIRAQGVKGDPLNLSADERVDYDADDLLGSPWSLERRGSANGSPEKSVQEKAPKSKAAKGKSDKLSRIGHGQVPFKGGEEALAPVSFRDIEQRATISFAAMRRLSVTGSDRSGAMRALLVALALTAHVHAFGRAFHLRSACDLRPTESTWTWLGSDGDESTQPLSSQEVTTLFRDCRKVAEAAGLLSGGGWDSDPLTVLPNPALTDAIQKTWPLLPVGA